MKRVLQFTSVFLIVVSILFGLTQISSLNEEREDMKYWKEAANENYGNDLIEEKYILLKDIYVSHLTITLASIISVILSGIFFLALASIITLLQEINSKVRKIPGDDDLELLN
ncbi:hypothetical protein ACQKII_17545 [Lysinibacillus sp. NPDC048646]|uniref:hypothetical protein n=1 Tax=Lysinibacillus sp. NPDC048646 TaxID=3390574 RepID=UPI00117C81B5|nr:hypothetical protein FOH38_24160 [Lysinibacillus fusiformis]